jgi:hypothetical protein
MRKSGCFVLSAALSTIALAGVSTLHETHKLLDTDGGFNDQMGISVDIAGATIAVGIHLDDGPWPGDATNAGSVPLFSAISAFQGLRLTAGGEAGVDRFGRALQLEGVPGGGRAIVGANITTGPGRASGVAYVLDLLTGIRTATLRPDLPTDGGPLSDAFGSSVAIEGPYALVGAPSHEQPDTRTGIVYVFDGATGSTLRRLLPGTGYQNHNFGRSVDLDGVTAAIGAFGDDTFANNAGAVFLVDAATGEPVRTLHAEDPEAGDWLGFSVAIEGDRVLAGAYRAEDDDDDEAGLAYLFDTRTGRQVAELRFPSGNAFDHFGISVDLADGYAIVGAPNHSLVAQHSGAAAVFDARTGTMLAVLEPSDGRGGDGFGGAVAVDGWLAVVTARNHDGQDHDAGAAYVFDLSGLDRSCGPADLAPPFAVLDLADLVAFIRSFSAGSPLADLDASGTYDVADVTSFVAAYVTGCQ